MYEAKGAAGLPAGAGTGTAVVWDAGIRAVEVEAFLSFRVLLSIACRLLKGE